MRGELAELYFAANATARKPSKRSTPSWRRTPPPRALQLKAQTLLGLGRYEESLPVLDAVMGRPPGPADGWNLYLKAVALQAIDRLSEALSAAEAAVERLPGRAHRADRAGVDPARGAGSGLAQSRRSRRSAVPPRRPGMPPRSAGPVRSRRGVLVRRPGSRLPNAPSARRPSANRTTPTHGLARQCRPIGGAPEEGDALLREAIADSPEPRTLDPSDVANLGWAHFMLGEFEAGRRPPRPRSLEIADAGVGPVRLRPHAPRQRRGQLGHPRVRAGDGPAP